jgi:Cd2+/Zn2+-exporting ATPase
MTKKNASDQPATPPDARPCVVENVARVLSEEPRLEAVAYEAKTKKLAMATLGPDPGHRLAERVSGAVGQPAGSQCAVVDASGLCAQCGESVDARAGQGRVVVKQVLGNTLIEKQTCATAIHFWRWENLRWPKFVPRSIEPPRPHAHGHDDHDDDHEHGHAHAPDEWKTLALQAGGCLAASLAGLGAEHWGAPTFAVLACWLAAYALGAWEAAEETWTNLRKGELDVHFLMLAVALGAAAIGAWHEGALLLFLFSASGAMEHYAMDRTQREIGSLLRGAPKTATVLEDGGQERETPVEELRPGMIVRVTGGEQVPVDLRVTKGESSCDESNLTGEARPVPKAVGDEALAGTINLQGLIEGSVLRPAGESALQKIIHLIETAQKMRAPSQRFTDRFGTGYTYAVLGLCAAMFCVWRFGFGLPAFVSADGGVKSAFYRAMTLLVVASPCALVLSIPSAILSAIAFGARRGVLFRGGAALEELAKINVVALDKTGTLTAGDLQLVRVETFHGDEAALRRIAYNLARFSDHPLSRTIKKVGQAQNLPLLEPDRFESIPGQGLRAVFGRQTYALGRCDLIREFLPPGKRDIDPAPEGAAEVYVGGPDLAGRLVFRDELRPESVGLLRQLREAGVRTVMLTGDRRATAERLALELGIEEVRAGLLPEQKLAAIQELKDGGRRRVAMVGDGVNDAPSLAAADVSVAMGARGSDAALEQAAVILMNDRVENFLLAYELSCRTARVIRQNLALSLGTVAVMATASLLGPVPLALGVAAHEGSTALVVLNSLRLLLGFGRRADKAVSSRPPEPKASSVEVHAV